MVRRAVRHDVRQTFQNATYLLPPSIPTPLRVGEEYA